MQVLSNHIKACLTVAKQYLQEKGALAPVALFYKEGLPDLPIPLNIRDQEAKERSQAFVQECILRLHPDHVVLVMETWMLELKGKDADEYEKKEYKPGDISKHPDRIEVITIVGGSVNGIEGVIQPFRHKGKKIIFGKPRPHAMGFETAFFGDIWSQLAAKESKGAINC